MEKENGHIVIFKCKNCGKYYIQGGTCPTCKDSEGNSIPTQIQAISETIFEEMLLKGEFFSK